MFAKFMNKKFFHPGAYPNEKKKWIREQKVAASQKVEKETQAMYLKEQESYQSRMLSAKSNEEKMKLGLNFLYDLPPGMKNKNDDDFDNEGDSKEKEVRFEWQKHAPRSKYIQHLGLDCQDQPFGVCVRNIRCFTCKAWGHQNTDRECPMFFSNVTAEANAEGSTSEDKGSLRLSDPLSLVNVMKEQHGLTFKKSVIGKEIDPMAEMAENQKMLASDDDGDELDEADLKFVESLSNKQKRRLLKRLDKLERKEKKRKERSNEGYHAGERSDHEDTTGNDKLFKKRKRRTSAMDNNRKDEEAEYQHQISGDKFHGHSNYARTDKDKYERKKHKWTTTETSSFNCEGYTRRKRRHSIERGSIETSNHKRNKSRSKERSRKK